MMIGKPQAGKPPAEGLAGGQEGGSSEFGKEVLVLKAATEKLSPFPADIKPKAMGITMALLLCGYGIFIYVTSVLPSCPLSKFGDDLVCAYASILWPGISATMFVMALSIMLRKHVRSLIGTQLPLLMCGGWLLDTAGHIAAAATDSDAYTAGMESNGADVTRALTVSAMAVALMLGAIVPTRLKAGLVSVSAVAFARLLAIAGHHAAVEGGVTWPIAAGVIAGVLGAYATLFLLRPDSVIAIMPTQLPGVIWKVARNGRMSVGGSNEDLVQRAMTLKLLAWACMMLTGGLLCLPGEMARGGLVHALALVSAAYSYALIRATTVAHGHLHQAQLDVAARNSSEVPHRSRRVSNLPRVPTRIVRSGIADIPEHGCPSMSRPLRPSSRMGSFRNFMRGSKDDPMAGGILSNLSRGRHSATIPGTEIVPSVVPSPAQQSVSRFQKVDVRFVEAPARQHSSAIASSTGSGHGDHGGTEEGGAGGVAKHRSRPKSLKAALREEVEEVLQAAAADGNARGSLEMMRGGPPAGSGMGIDAAAGGGGGDTGGEANGERVGRERGGEGGAEKASTGGEEGALVLDGVFSAEIGHVGGAVAPIDVEEGGKEGRKGAEGERGRSRSPSGTAR